MLGVGEHLGIDIIQTHIIHSSLIGQVSAVLVITHADGGTRRMLVLANQITRIYTFRFQTALYQIAEAVVADHAAEGNLCTQCCRVRREDSRRTT